MAQEEMEIEISPDGKVKVRTIGIKGTRCLEVAQIVARAVGQEESRQLTSEYYEAPAEVHHQIDVRRQT